MTCEIERAAVVEFITKAAVEANDTVRNLHRKKMLTPMMSAEWNAMICAYSGIAAAIRRGEHLRPPTAQ